MESFTLGHHTHRRYNPLNGEWVLASPHRISRPWQGQVEDQSPDERPPYDPSCYLCPGNLRANGERNTEYTHTFVFTNDFPALLPDTPLTEDGKFSLLRFESQPGTCRVICFSPRHDLTLPEMALADIRRVVDVWAEQVLELRPHYRWVQVFENKGATMGCSNPHPHGQVWATASLPNEPYKEDRQQASYWAEQGRPLLLDYAALEREREERIVVENRHWMAVVPFWAIWPYEILLLPRRHVMHLPGLTDEERDAAAEILKRLLTRYDNLFQTSFPYSMGWHGAPGGKGMNDHNTIHWQLHAHFYPPLLRSASVKKFMVGYELLAEAQRDLAAEWAANRLRELDDRHYKESAVKDRA